MKLDDLKGLEKESLDRGVPIIGSKKGKWLYDKVFEVQPVKVLELGTANGYSGSILGSTGAELFTIEHDKIIAQEAQKNFEKYKIKAHIAVGEALEVLRKLVEEGKHQKSFDIVFIDFAKKEYLPALEYCISLCKVGGYIIADNITFSGCQDYRQRVQAHPQLKTDIILIQDGLACSQKLSSW
ncbi:class I SAM-dependent methyltransferase [Candidatus Woesearchaeota archaeon]|nr:class I SAM-dependent methyltransferase [Candidatus Woesearchaeota archaeon]